MAAWRFVAAACRLGSKVPKRSGSISGAEARKRRRKKETVKMKKSKAEPVSSWCYQRQAGSMKALQRVVWSVIFGECGGAGKVQVQQRIEKITLSNSPSRLPMEDDALAGDL